MKLDVEKLKGILGEKNVSDSPADLYVYSSDASVHQAKWIHILHNKKP